MCSSDLLGLTGTYLVFDQDFESVPLASAQGTVQTPSAIIGAVLTAQPGAKAQALVMPQRLGEPAIVRLARQGGGRGFGPQIYVDPVSLDVLGRRDNFRNPVTALFHDLHGSLALGGATGRPLVGWLGVFMTFLGLSGLYLWWPSNGRFRKSIGVSKNARGFLLQRQLHTSFGVAFWLVFIVVSFSGAMISFPRQIGPVMQAAFGAAPPPRNAKIEPVPGATPIDATQAAELALAAAEGSHLGTIVLPADESQPYRMTLVADGALAGAPTIAATVDPYKREVTSLRDPRTLGFADSFVGWQRTLHDGRALGWPWKVLVAFSGLLPPLFVVTGTWMWLARRKARQYLRATGHGATQAVPAE